MDDAKCLNMVDILKREIVELQSTNHHLMIRIKELNEEINNLKRQIGIDD